MGYIFDVTHGFLCTKSFEISGDWPPVGSSKRHVTLLSLIFPLKCLSKSSLNVLLTDAFARVIFTHLVADTRVIWETRSPTWDQMLVFKDLVLWGDVNEIAVNPPTIVIEIFDKDIGVSKDLFHIDSPVRGPQLI